MGQLPQAWAGRLDVLINNAGVMLWGGGFDAPLADWERVWAESFAINAMAPARLLRRAVPHFLENNGGTIITVSSWSAQRGFHQSGQHCLRRHQGRGARRHPNRWRAPTPRGASSPISWPPAWCTHGCPSSLPPPKVASNKFLPGWRWANGCHPRKSPTWSSGSPAAAAGI